MNEFDYIFFCGDIHGDYDVIPNFIRDHKLYNAAVVVVGDFGIGFEIMRTEIRRLNYLNDRMKNTNSTLFTIRGNHDNPLYFTGKFDKSNVKLISDYTVLELNGNNILCIGGAISVDRKHRKSYFKPTNNYNNIGELNPNDYWKDEIINYDYNKVEGLKNIEYVITHSSPHFAFPYVKNDLYNWSINDAHLLNDVSEERKKLSHIYNQLNNNGNKIKKWFYGHYHSSNRLPYKDTYFISLNINEIVEI